MLSIKSVHSLSIENISLFVLSSISVHRVGSLENISLFVLLSYIFTDSDEIKEEATSNVKVSNEHCSTIY